MAGRKADTDVARTRPTRSASASLWCTGSLATLSGRAAIRRRRQAARRLARHAVVAVVLALVLSAPAGATAWATLPDGRAYEMVTPPDKNGVTSAAIVPAPSGDAVDWEAPGGCCGSTTGGEELYQSSRTATGWVTAGLTPVPSRPLVGLFETQRPVFFTSDLAKTIYATPESYDPLDQDEGSVDLYLAEGAGAPIWISRGQLGGSAPDRVTFDGASADANVIAFSTREPLTADATPLRDLNTPPEYLYVRNVAAGTTQLVDVDNSDHLISPDGAALGDGGLLGQEAPANTTGSTTNAVSQDGTKVFFETPPYGVNDLNQNPFHEGEEVEPSHLYMRDLATSSTTEIDDPHAPGFARYEGAAQDGSLVFFTSNEGLGGDPYHDIELYEFNTTGHAIGPAPPMSVIPVSAGDAGTPAQDGHLLGITAVANDGSRVYFVAKEALTATANGLGQTASAGAANLYEYDTATGQTSFIATVDGEDAAPGPLTGEPDVTRPAIPTPDGSVLVFESRADLTGRNPAGPSTALTEEAPPETRTLAVADTSGFQPGRDVEVQSAPISESVEIESVQDATHLVLARPLQATAGPGTTVREKSVLEIYRYGAADHSLTCASCTAAGVEPVGSALLTGAGGSYAPPRQATSISADGSRIFFMTQDALVPEDDNGNGLDVYEWEDGSVHLISDGQSLGAFLFATTPSGNDVFFATSARLVAQDTDGYFDTYDARVGGGFPAPPPASGECEPGGCGSPTSDQFIELPGSAMLGPQSEPAPPAATRAFSVAAISARQRAAFLRTGRLRLTVHVTVPGQLRASVWADAHRRTLLASTALEATTRGTFSLLLRVRPRRLRALSRAHARRLTVEVRDSASAVPQATQLTLKARGAVHVQRARVRGRDR